AALPYSRRDSAGGRRRRVRRFSWAALALSAGLAAGQPPVPPSPQPALLAPVPAQPVVVPATPPGGSLVFVQPGPDAMLVPVSPPGPLVPAESPWDRHGGFDVIFGLPTGLRYL